MVRQTALGISEGDIITTSYDTGPYIVKRVHPALYWYKTSDLVVRPYPVTSMALAHYPKHGGEYAGINQVRRVDNRWFSGVNDEIFVQKPDHYSLEQVSMFDLFPTADGTEETPYVFQDGVDYLAGDGCLWHCEHCGKDYNTELRGLAKRSDCPFCGWFPIALIYIDHRVNHENAYWRWLNFPVTR